MRKILFVTGTRAEYGLMRPILRAINSHPNLSLSVVATGMHLSHEFGYSVKEIEKDGFSIIARLPLLHKEDTLKGMSKYLGRLVFHLSDIVEKEKPDFIITIGDRDEAFAAAIIGSHMNIPVAHLHGGERTGTVDEFMRHAITKMSHLHLCATEESKRRLIKLGEEPFRIQVVGAPALDIIRNREYMRPKEISESFGLDLSKPIVLVIQHPVTTEFGSSEGQMKQTMDAVASLGMQTVLIYPNADAGGRAMIKVIEKYKRYQFLKTYKNLPNRIYLGLLAASSVIVGNSSSGIIEAPMLHAPAVNIGTRQKFRQRSSNVIDVPHDSKKIVEAIKKSLHNRNFIAKVKKCASPYGNGHAAEKVVKILNSAKIGTKLVQKHLAY
ncbi:UDP-N-acetylglucosamine 2-epimerase (hydrolyzing) [Candidatus Woesearchaeota archaeon]|nr:UDP-N-acetylglucosamine 2-epimerase (hydrolyzing) [Candidatus Woesearchaeota archaeon]